MTKRGYSEPFKLAATWVAIIGVAYGISSLDSRTKKENPPKRYFNVDITLGRVDSPVSYLLEKKDKNALVQKVGIKATYNSPPIPVEQKNLSHYGKISSKQFGENEEHYRELFKTAFEECNSRLEQILETEVVCPPGQLTTKTEKHPCSFSENINYTNSTEDKIQTITLDTEIIGSIMWDCVPIDP